MLEPDLPWLSEEVNFRRRVHFSYYEKFRGAVMTENKECYFCDVMKDTIGRSEIDMKLSLDVFKHKETLLQTSYTNLKFCPECGKAKPKPKPMDEVILEKILEEYEEKDLSTYESGVFVKIRVNRIVNLQNDLLQWKRDGND